MVLEKITMLTNALEYIENNLSVDFSQAGCAKAACCSLSGLQKLFRYAFHISIGDYVKRRRLTLAARDLQKGRSALDTAIKYGYGSAEAFTRAFTAVWGVSPSKYRKTHRFSGIFPKLYLPDEHEYEGEIIMTRQFDISELYDYIKAKEGTYVIVFDTYELDRINNEYGIEVGDGIIRECLRRIDAHAGDDMLMFRISGDSYALVTGLSDKDEVTAAAGKILGENGNEITCNGITLPVSMKAGAVMLGDNRINYSDLFTELENAPGTTPEEFVIN